MLLLQRKANQSVVIHKNDDKTESMVIRVVEVLPSGDITLGFMGGAYNVVRSEIFNNGDTNMEWSSKHEHNNNYYS